MNYYEKNSTQSVQQDHFIKINNRKTWKSPVLKR